MTWSAGGCREPWDAPPHGYSKTLQMVHVMIDLGPFILRLSISLFIFAKRVWSFLIQKQDPKHEEDHSQKMWKICIVYKVKTQQNFLICFEKRLCRKLTWSGMQACRNRKAVQKLVHDVERRGYKGLIITVDCPTAGYREQDMRNHFALPEGCVQTQTWTEAPGASVQTISCRICAQG